MRNGSRVAMTNPRDDEWVMNDTEPITFVGTEAAGARIEELRARRNSVDLHAVLFAAVTQRLELAQAVEIPEIGRAHV